MPAIAGNAAWPASLVMGTIFVPLMSAIVANTAGLPLKSPIAAASNFVATVPLVVTIGLASPPLFPWSIIWLIVGNWLKPVCIELAVATLLRTKASPALGLLGNWLKMLSFR